MEIGPNKNRKKLKFMTEEEKKARKKKIIFGCFIAFIILFGSVSILCFLKSYDYDLSKVFGQGTEKVQGEEETTTKPVEMEGSATILLTGSSTNKDELYFVALIKADLDNMQVSVCCLPTSAIARVGNVSATLEENFKTGGAKQLVQAANQYTGVKIDRYVAVGEKNFKKATRYLGNYSLTLDEKITYNGGDFSLNLVKGKQTLTGDKLMHYIRYQEKQGGEYLDAQARIICDMIDQMVCERNIDEGEELFNQLINIVDSDISIVDYTKSSPYIQGYAGSEKRQSSVSAEISDFKE